MPWYQLAQNWCHSIHSINLPSNCQLMMLPQNQPRINLASRCNHGNNMSLTYSWTMASFLRTIIIIIIIIIFITCSSNSSNVSRMRYDKSLFMRSIISGLLHQLAKSRPNQRYRFLAVYVTRSILFPWLLSAMRQQYNSTTRSRTSHSRLYNRRADMFTEAREKNICQSHLALCIQSTALS